MVGIYKVPATLGRIINNVVNFSKAVKLLSTLDVSQNVVSRLSGLSAANRNGLSIEGDKDNGGAKVNLYGTNDSTFPGALGLWSSFGTGIYDGILINNGGQVFLGGMRLVEIDIGAWDMSTNLTLDVAHGLGVIWKYFRFLEATVINDALTLTLRLGDGIDAGSSCFMGSANIHLQITAGGTFNTASYSSTTISRGKILLLQNNNSQVHN